MNYYVDGFHASNYFRLYCLCLFVMINGTLSQMQVDESVFNK
jgi:hypothetical protein